MQEPGSRNEYPVLKELVIEASRALARLDADRLEELAVSCQALNRALAPADSAFKSELARQTRRAQGDMAVFARVLEATRANLAVVHRLRALRRNSIHQDQVEYGESQIRNWARTEPRHGDD